MTTGSFRQHSAKTIEDFWAEVDRIEKDNRGNIPWPVRDLVDLDEDYGDRDKPAHMGGVKAPPRDNVNLPHHYARYKIEPIQFLMENKVDAFQFNIVKYVLRHDAKNGKEDIKKVLRYAEMYLKYLSDDPDWWKPSTMTIGGGYFP